MGVSTAELGTRTWDSKSKPSQFCHVSVYSKCCFTLSAQRPHPLRTPLRFLLNLVIPNTPAEKAGLARTKYFIEQGRGYDIEQSTRPQTIGYALADSPVGLLAWMYEKLVDWTDDYPWTDDEGCSSFQLLHF